MDRYTGSITKEGNKETQPKPTLKERLERNFLFVIGGVLAVAVTSTYFVCSYFFNEHLKLAQEDADRELEKKNKELQDLNSRLSSIVPKIGDTGFWDLSAMVLTPAQTKTLSQEYKYHPEIHVKIG